jgi:hypothetical protein
MDLTKSKAGLCLLATADGLFDFEGGPCYMVGDRFYEGVGDLIIDSVKAD